MKNLLLLCVFLILAYNLTSVRAQTATSPDYVITDDEVRMVDPEETVVSSSLSGLEEAGYNIRNSRYSSYSQPFLFSISSISIDLGQTQRVRENQTTIHIDSPTNVGYLVSTLQDKPFVDVSQTKSIPADYFSYWPQTFISYPGQDDLFEGNDMHFELSVPSEYDNYSFSTTIKLIIIPYF